MAQLILVTYATRYGSTQGVAEVIAAKLVEAGCEVDIFAMTEVESIKKYHAVVLGAPLYIGKLHKDTHRFLAQHREMLLMRSVAMFALGPISPDPDEMVGSRGQFDKELAQYDWLKPVATEVFVGKYDPAKLNFLHKLLAILPASPLHSLPSSDHRNWADIQMWAQALPAQLGVMVPATQ